MGNRNICDLHPKFNVIVQKVTNICKYIDLDIRVLDTFRTPTRQEELYEAGASKVKRGWHNFGLACDFGVFTRDGKYCGSETPDNEYFKLGLIAKSLDCIWGGDWKFKDLGHIEWHPGFTLAQYMAFFKKEGRDPWRHFGQQ